MSCLAAEAHINITPLCPPGLMTQDTIHLISQQVAGSLIAPIIHQHQLQPGQLSVLQTTDGDGEVWSG